MRIIVENFHHDGAQSVDKNVEKPYALGQMSKILVEKVVFTF